MNRSPRRSPTPVTSGLAARSGWIGSIARFWEKTYAPDYIGFTVLLVSYLFIIFFVTPFHRMFFLANLNLQYPHAEVERVSVGWNMIYAGAVPLVTLMGWLAAARADVHKLHITVLGFLVSLVLTVFLTDVVKNAVGRPRPDLISRCKPAPGTPVDRLVTIDVCTEPNKHVLQDGWRSFPSGHSSFAFAGLGFLSLFLSGQLHVFRPRADLGRVMIALAPVLGAAMIAISRCEDYRHDVYDVTCGAILGMSVTYFSYRRYYPRLHSPKCHEPFPSREAIFNAGFSKIKNDEETLREAREYDLDDMDNELDI